MRFLLCIENISCFGTRERIMYVFPSSWWPHSPACGWPLNVKEYRLAEFLWLVENRSYTTSFLDLGCLNIIILIYLNVK